MTHQPAKGTPTMLDLLTRWRGDGDDLKTSRSMARTAETFYEELVKLVQEWRHMSVPATSEGGGMVTAYHQCADELAKIIGMPKDGGEDGRA